jgi:hypothetical protein
VDAYKDRQLRNLVQLMVTVNPLPINPGHQWFKDAQIQIIFTGKIMAVEGLRSVKNG